MVYFLCHAVFFIGDITKSGLKAFCQIKEWSYVVLSNKYLDLSPFCRTLSEMLTFRFTYFFTTKLYFIHMEIATPPLDKNASIVNKI